MSYQRRRLDEARGAQPAGARSEHEAKTPMKRPSETWIMCRTLECRVCDIALVSDWCRLRLALEVCRVSGACLPPWPPRCALFLYYSSTTSLPLSCSTRRGEGGALEREGTSLPRLGARGPLRLPEGAFRIFSVAWVPDPELVPREAPISGEVGCEPRAEFS